MNDYEKNLAWAIVWMKNYEEKKPNDFVKVRLSKLEKSSDFMVIFSFQAFPSEHYPFPHFATAVSLFQSPKDFKQEMLNAYLTYIQIAQKTNSKASPSD